MPPRPRRLPLGSQETPEETVTHACERVKTSAFGVSFLIVCVWVIGLSPLAHFLRVQMTQKPLFCILYMYVYICA